VLNYQSFTKLYTSRNSYGKPERLIKYLAAASVLGLAVLMGMSESAAAQGNRDYGQDRRSTRERERVARERAKAEQLRIRAEQRRQAAMNRRNNNRNNGNHYGWENGTNNPNRYRVNRNGSYYNTDQRGAELLRQAVRSGYEQGLRAGQNDRNSRRRSSWTSNSEYRSGSYGYDSHVARNQYQHYFQQGFQKGYQDGYNSRSQYGSNNNGSGSILGTILNQILNIQPY
jgi:hypothetical protein